MIHPLSFQLWAFVGVAVIAARVVYNLYFHPLARFPGPRLASATRFWKAWLECVREARTSDELAKLHAIYGPIVRITPDELHFADPEAYHQIYNSKNKWDKEARLYRMFRVDLSSFGFLKYHEAKERKEILNKSFSLQAITACEPLILAKLTELCAVLETKDPAEAVDMSYAFRSFALDLISFLSFGADTGALKTPNFQAPLLMAMDDDRELQLALKHSDIVSSLVRIIPLWLVAKFNPKVESVASLLRTIHNSVDRFIQNPEQGLADLPHKMTIFNRMLDPALNKGRVPSRQGLFEEAQTLTFAGADTVGNALQVGTFHLLKNPTKLARLRTELKEAWPTLDGPSPQLKVLESLPYLDGVIRESLRMSYGVPTNMPRVVPPEGATIMNEKIPGGAIVSTICTFLHDNPTIFESPSTFEPERWIKNPELDEWLVAFGRGPRMCLGINLAWAELRLVFAHIFRRFDLTAAASSPTRLEWRAAFLPIYTSGHIQAHVRPVSD